MDCIGASGFDAHSCPAQCRLATTAKLKAHAQLPNSTFELSSHTHPPNHSFRLRCTRAGRATGVLGSHASLQQSHGWSCARRCPPTDAQLTMFQSCKLHPLADFAHQAGLPPHWKERCFRRGPRALGVMRCSACRGAKALELPAGWPHTHDDEAELAGCGAHCQDWCWGGHAFAR